MPGLPPDFVIVGAPRAGTTTMYHYLRSVPKVYMPANKEPHFFGRDLTHQHAPMSRAEYLDLFAGHRPGQLTGEASPLYMLSETAAAEIASHRPEARIIVMLRDPVALMRSMHQQNVATGVEDVTDFTRALDLEASRRAGRHLPSRVRAVDALRYRDIGRLADQLERVYAAFPREQVHVTLFDDLQADPENVLAGVSRFLGVPSGRHPDEKQRNRRSAPRSWHIQHWLTHPTPPFDRLAAYARRHGAAHTVRGWLLDMNRQPTPASALDPQLAWALRDEFRPQVERLILMTGRDLSSWLVQAAGKDGRPGTAGSAA